MERSLFWERGACSEGEGLVLGERGLFYGIGACCVCDRSLFRGGGACSRAEGLVLKERACSERGMF